MSTSGGYGGKTIVVTTAAVGAFVATVGAVFGRPAVTVGGGVRRHGWKFRSARAGGVRL